MKLLEAIRVPAGKNWGGLTYNQTAPSEPGTYKLYRYVECGKPTRYEWVKEEEK